MTNNVFSEIFVSDTFREEFFVAEVQARLSEMMEEKGVTRAELARRLDVSRGRITQIFSDECKNLTVRLLVRGFLALGEQPIIVSRSEYDRLKDNHPRAASTASQTGSQDFDGIAEAVIANLLRASIGERSVDNERAKRTTKPSDWASAGSNVIPMRERANG